ncbi:hypothetical protein MKO06_06620 [Gramella sp. GC03-9]|uniref:Uncharacterized protein n=1 Tax=Christiangramia oceanisediminis TaxID=2920386 RepID=A0A9X2KVV2_9FLAO|nr:hypothetical protein [Gramella oceanisediminis]MCP9199572.1 hypothetical protein [Gramella oceanisediminis]
MNSVICTLSEGSYHFGVAALINSLNTHGFKGEIYIGYRGELPEWAKNSETISSKSRSLTIRITQGFSAVFMPLETDSHFAFYKPDFILKIFVERPEIDAVFYFDPDIVIKCHWKNFDSWAQHGVALVHEIVANDMPGTHPKRAEWNKVIKKANKEPVRYISSYLNSGFCGVTREYLEFVRIWKHIIEIGRIHYGLNVRKLMSRDMTDVFAIGDQDAFNMAAMCADVPISEVGPEGMDFLYGGIYMSHAAGKTKPWIKSYIYESLRGNPPSLADKNYWINVQHPLKLYSKSEVLYKNLVLKTASFVGRFYRRY